MTKVMSDNLIPQRDDGSVVRDIEKVKEFLTRAEDHRAQDANLAALEEAGKRKKYEKITSLLGVTNQQYLTILYFENYYRSRKNQGLRSIEKNQDVVLAKNLFQVWDTKRDGFIKQDTLVSNLIALGLAGSKGQVMRLVSLLKKNEQKEERQLFPTITR